MSSRRPLTKPSTDKGLIGVLLGVIFVIGINLAWLAFVVWAIYSVVTWLVAQ